MKNAIGIIGLVILIFGCQTKDTHDKVDLEGDLYYPWLKLGSFYQRPDSIYQLYQHLRDSLGIAALREQDSTGTAFIELLESNKLIRSPFIYLKTDSGTISIIYMTMEDYKPITKFTYQDLINSAQKIRLRLATESLTDEFHICKKVFSIEVVNGETLEKQKKFKIEEYR
jgi:hypothetical protein